MLQVRRLTGWVDVRGGILRISSRRVLVAIFKNCIPTESKKACTEHGKSFDTRRRKSKIPFVEIKEIYDPVYAVVRDWSSLNHLRALFDRTSGSTPPPLLYLRAWSRFLFVSETISRVTQTFAKSRELLDSCYQTPNSEIIVRRINPRN